MRAKRTLRFRFSLRTLLLLMPVFGLVAAWIARAEQQREAVAALRKLDPYPCVFYNFDPEGSCAGVLGHNFQPGWLERSIGVDYFYNARNVFVNAEQIELAIPHLKRLRWLAEIYVTSDRGDGSDEAETAAQKRINITIQRLRGDLPSVKVEEHPSCPILVSRIPVVG